MRTCPRQNAAKVLTLPLPPVVLSLAITSPLFLSGCLAPPPLRLPPLTADPTGEYHVGKPVWFDLLTEDVLAAKNFYGLLFRWQFKQAKEYPDYSLIYSEGTPIGGMVLHENRHKDLPESRWLVSLSVQHVDRAVALVTQEGGELLAGPLDVEHRGRMALIADPAGAPLLLLRATGGDPPDTEPARGSLFWTDLFTTDAAAASAFYTKLGGYTPETVDAGDEHEYRVLVRNGKKQAGVVELRWEKFNANWLPYVKVDDVKVIIAEAKKLGASTILQMENVAILADPTGAAFGIQGPRGRRP